MALQAKLKNALSSTKRRVLAVLSALSLLTGTAAGVRALIPNHDTLDANFSAVTAYPEVSLDQYDALMRTEGVIEGSASPKKTGMVTYSLAAATTTIATTAQASQDSTSGASGTSGATGKATTSIVRSPTHTLSSISVKRAILGRSLHAGVAHDGGKITHTTPGISFPTQRPPQTATVASSPPRRAFQHVQGALVTEGTGASQGKVSAVVKALAKSGAKSGAHPTVARVVLPKNCSSLCGATQEIDKALTYDPNPARAADAVAAIFNDSRGEVVGKRLYPIGAMVSYTIKLDGFAHKQVTLEWSLLATGGSHAPPRPWWRDVIVAHIEPTVDHESLSGQFWAPIPPEHGDYAVRLVLLDTKGVSYASSESTPDFH